MNVILIERIHGTEHKKIIHSNKSIIDFNQMMKQNQKQEWKKKNQI